MPGAGKRPRNSHPPPALPSLTEPWTKVTVVLTKREVAYLDEVRLMIRIRHRKAVSRAEVIRGLLEFMVRSRIDFTKFETIDAMTEYLTKHFAGIAEK